MLSYENPTLVGTTPKDMPEIYYPVVQLSKGWKRHRIIQVAVTVKRIDHVSRSTD